MPRTRSIKQNHPYDALPDFRSLGVALRTLLLVNGAALLLALLRGTSWSDVLQQFMQSAALLQPVLLASLLLLYALNIQLARLPYIQGSGAVVLIVVSLAIGMTQLGRDIYLPSSEHGGFIIWRYGLSGTAAAIMLLIYFRLRTRALTPAIYGARLQALQARIRPHFLFNCINTVLSVVRNDPRRAESALEDMSDLFRMAMEDDQVLVLLSKEIELSRRYLALEELRLGERLAVIWHTDGLPDDAMVPPLMLQPLLENAVYHGIEPLSDGGIINIRVERRGNELHFDIVNPRQEPGAHHIGQKLALANIRERLALQFDIEANYTVESKTDFYRVHITMPYIKREYA